MPRLPRYAIADVPQHVIQRGTNQCPIFLSEEDFRFFLQCMKEACLRHFCQVHAYVLMTNHIHFLMTPLRKDSTSRVMHLVGTRHAQYFNARHARTGALWQGRYRDILVDSERYLLTCYRYIELNPVRANLVADPAHYRWSSYHANAMGRRDLLITPHDVYLSLGRNIPARLKAYQALFDTEIPAGALGEIRNTSRKGWVLGTDAFREEMQRVSGRRTKPLPRGGKTKTKKKTKGVRPF